VDRRSGPVRQQRRDEIRRLIDAAVPARDYSFRVVSPTSLNPLTGGPDHSAGRAAMGAGSFTEERR
jgi:hypothetical protein